MERIGVALAMLAMVGCGSNGQARPEVVTASDGSPGDSATAHDGAAPEDAGLDGDGAIPDCPVSDGGAGAYPILPSPEYPDASGALCNPTGTQIDWYTFGQIAGGGYQNLGGPFCNCPSGTDCYQGPQGGIGPLVYCRAQ